MTATIAALIYVLCGVAFCFWLYKFAEEVV